MYKAKHFLQEGIIQHTLDNMNIINFVVIATYSRQSILLLPWQPICNFLFEFHVTLKALYYLSRTPPRYSNHLQSHFSPCKLCQVDHTLLGLVITEVVTFAWRDLHLSWNNSDCLHFLTVNKSGILENIVIEMYSHMYYSIQEWCHTS